MHPRQQGIHDFICDYPRQYPRPPIVREIGAGIEVKSSYTVRRHLNKLVKIRHSGKNDNL